MVNKRKHILVAPLDWGLGHATRCVPIIKLLVENGSKVSIAGNGASLQLLRKEFPALSVFELPGYNPVYPAKGSMAFTMARQLPGFVHTINREHRALEALVDQYNIDVVISDNRYGCWSAHTKSIFITHQSNILMPKRFGWLAPLIRRASKFAIRKFDMCWIPDFNGQLSLAGDLIEFADSNFHRHVEFIGPLTRFKQVPGASHQYDLVAVCSGPEPQRTMFEELLRKQLSSHKNFLLIRGIIGHEEEQRIGNGVVKNYMTSEELNDSLAAAKVVIARSGFSTVMDLSALGKKAIFIPTPGQTEQEYLAERLKSKGIAFYMEQDEFDLDQALAQTENYAGFINGKTNSDLLKRLLEQVVLV